MGREKVADGQGENHQGARDQPGRGQRQHEAGEDRRPTSAEVGRRFEQVIVERLEGQPKPEHHEREIIVDEDERGRSRAEEQHLDRTVDHAGPDEEAIQHAFPAEDQAPGKDAH